MNIDLNSILTVVFGILISIISYLSRSRIERIEQKQAEDEKEIKEIVTNYKDRFEDVKDTINTNYLLLIDKISGIKDDFVAKEYCKIIHKEEI